MLANHHKVLPLSLAALGVVYGDIGTSPLYAVRASLLGLPLNQTNIFGVLSLIFWALILVISTRYLTIILRVDNNGEGGVLALLALIKKRTTSYGLFFFIGIIGAGLLLGDGMLTPAISVLSAFEGLQIASPSLTHYVIPFTLFVLFILFLCQRFGTTKIGFTFGPIILCWFMVLAVIGAARIIQQPDIIQAINPYYAFEFFRQGGWVAYALLGGIFLVITGAEALYADLGHFGKTPIRIGWYAIALPGLLLNYFGQGAYLLQFPKAIENPFYAMAPSWFLYPLLILAAVATIIASQAIISATFSLIKQAILLNLSPRVSVIQTSNKEKGQVYVPKVNVVLAIGTLLLVVIFKNSTALAGAYGLAVNLVMIVVAILVMMVARQQWQWSIAKILRVFFVFVVIDFAFLGANLHKFLAGGWIPLAFAAVCATIMLTWHKGMGVLRASYHMNRTALVNLSHELHHHSLQAVPNSIAIFVTDPYDQSGGCLLHYLKLNRIMPDQVLLVSTKVKDRPYMTGTERFELKKLIKNIHHLILHVGFMESPNIPADLSTANQLKLFPFDLDIKQTVFLVEIPHITATRQKQHPIFFWQEKLFAFLMRNSVLDIEFFQLPYNQTIAIGTYWEI